jgi:hypothetical protein
MLTCLAAAAQTNTKLPANITTLDGRTYHGVAEQAVAVYPDGIVIGYQPEAGGQAVAGGIGTAKLKYRNPPEELQRRYSYDAKAAADCEKQQEQAEVRWRQVQQETEEQGIVRYRNLAELNRSLAGDADASYSVSMDSKGKVSAQGYSRPIPAQVITTISQPTTTDLPPHNPLFNWPEFIPVQNGFSTVVVPK